MARHIPEDILIAELRRIAGRFDSYFIENALRGKTKYLTKKQIDHLFDKLIEHIQYLADQYGDP